MVQAIGFKITLKVLGQHPALLLTTVFSNFTFGPNQIKCCSRENETNPNYLKVSLPLTLVNFGISSLEICFIWIYKAIRLGKFFTETDIIFVIPCSIINFFTLLLLHLVPKCKACCCQCCQNHCYPVHQLIALDPNQPFELIQLPLPEPKENIKLQVFQGLNSIPNDIENDETRRMSETKNDIKLPVLPRFPDITACK